VQISKGDIFQLGNHKIACGDSCNKGLVKKLIMDEQVNLILSDPPYGIAYVEGKKGFNELKNKRKIVNDHEQTDREYIDFTKNWVEVLIPHLASKNTYYIFNSDKMIFALRNALVGSDFKFSQLLVWIKNHAIVGRLDYCPQHELIAYGWYGTHSFKKSKDKSLIYYPKPHKSTLHPTMKPVGLLRRLILNSSSVNDVVFDPFLGSGSTLIACEQTKRVCLGLEIDPDYCQTIINRFEKVTGIKAKKV